MYLELQRLTNAHQTGFDCGAPAQNEFIASLAASGQQAGISATHLAYDGDTLVGFITLAMSTVRLEKHERPAAAPVSSLPALLVAQLAVDKSAHGKGVGVWLLRFASGVAQSLRHQAGCRYLAVDCETGLVPYYQKFGFEESAGEKRSRKARMKSASPGAPPPSHRLCRDLLDEDWYEVDVAPPHHQLTELHRAAADDDASMLLALLKAGVDPAIGVGRSDDGLTFGATPLHFASARGSLRAIEVLLAHGAEINASDGDCETSLHWAVRHNQSKAVSLLLKLGAHPSIEGGNGVLTPLDYAVHSRRDEIAALLREAGAVHSEEWENGEAAEQDTAAPGPGTA